MKQLLLFLSLFVALGSQAQVVNVQAMDNFGGTKQVLGSATAVLTAQDSAGAAGTKLANKQFVTAQGYLTQNQTITFNGTGDVSGFATGTTNLSTTLSLRTLGTAGTYAYPSSVTTDAQGRVTGIVAGSQGGGSVTAGETGFTTTAAQTVFPVTGSPNTIANIIMTRNGVKLIPTTDFTATVAGTVTATNTRFTMAAGDNVQIQYFK